MQLESQPSYKTERRNVWTEGSSEASGSASLVHTLMNKVEGDRCCLKMPSGPHMSVVTHNCTHPTENNKIIKTPFIRIYTPVFIYKTQSLKKQKCKVNVLPSAMLDHDAFLCLFFVFKYVENISGSLVGLELAL